MKSYQWHVLCANVYTSYMHIQGSRTMKGLCIHIGQSSPWAIVRTHIYLYVHIWGCSSSPLHTIKFKPLIGRSHCLPFHHWENRRNIAWLWRALLLVNPSQMWVLLTNTPPSSESLIDHPKPKDISLMLSTEASATLLLKGVVFDCHCDCLKSQKIISCFSVWLHLLMKRTHVTYFLFVFYDMIFFWLYVFWFSNSMMCEEDPSTMTIEFLRARLQLQRAEYRAEKRRAQVLAQKVLSNPIGCKYIAIVYDLCTKVYESPFSLSHYWNWRGKEGYSSNGIWVFFFF